MECKKNKCENISYKKGFCSKHYQEHIRNIKNNKYPTFKIIADIRRIVKISATRLSVFISDNKVKSVVIGKVKYFDYVHILEIINKNREQEKELYKNKIEIRDIKIKFTTALRRTADRLVPHIIFIPVQGHYKYFYKKEDIHLLGTIKPVLKTKAITETIVSKDVEEAIIWYLEDFTGQPVTRRKQSRFDETKGEVFFYVDNTGYDIQITPKALHIVLRENNKEIKPFDSIESFLQCVKDKKAIAEIGIKKLQKEKREREKRYMRIITR